MKTQIHHPHIMNRFIVRFPYEFDIPEFMIKELNKPKLINGNWSNIEILLYTLIGPSTSRCLLKIDEFAKKNSNKEKLFDFTIDCLDPEGLSIEKWWIEVGSIPEIDFGYLSYSENGSVLSKLTIKPLNCHFIY